MLLYDQLKEEKRSSHKWGRGAPWLTMAEAELPGLTGLCSVRELRVPFASQVGITFYMFPNREGAPPQIHFISRTERKKKTKRTTTTTTKFQNTSLRRQ